MKPVFTKTFTQFSLCVSLSAALAACGGSGNGPSTPTSGSSTPSTPTPTNSQQLTGKAIDGYLAGAAVCLDLNNNGVCDTGEPSVTTDASGNFALPYSGDPVGKQLLVMVTPTTRDLSRAAGFQFPASFTLSQVIQDAASQNNITPLTTMVVAQMQVGLSHAQAVAAVQALAGSAVDPDADYVAGGDTATSTLAGAIVDKLASFAANATVSPATVQNVLNAIVAKGGVASVTQTDVTAQAELPSYALADASQVLANPTYSVDSFQVPYFGGGGVAQGATLQDVRQLVNGTLQLTRQEMPVGASAFQTIAGTTWYDYLTGAQSAAGSQSIAAGKYDGMAGAYELKSDGTWSGLISNTALHAALPVTTVGSTLSGTDPNTGVAFSVEYRQFDTGGQTFASAIPAVFGLLDLWTLPQLTGANFAAGTAAYAGILTHAQDQIILPVLLPQCSPPVTVRSGLACGVPAAAQDGVVDFVEGNATTTYTAVQQVIGLPLQAGLTLVTGGKVQLGSQVSSTSSWSTYAGNPNVLIINLSTADAASIDPRRGTPLQSGAKLVVALRSGHLQTGWLYPSNYAERTVQFASGLPAQLVSAVNVAIAAQQ